MKVIYISALSSQNLIRNIYYNTRSNPGFAVQNFTRLLVRGIVINQVECSVLSVPPINSSHKLSVNIHNEIEDCIEYRYVPFVNLPVIKHLCVFLYTFCYVLFWGIKDRSKKAIICDVLCISSSVAALLASKICGLMSIAVVTDIYSQMVGQYNRGINALISKLAGWMNSIYVRSFSKYILLTEAMNELVNPKGRPYMVMEGLCDVIQPNMERLKWHKDFPKVILYAGGLEERYGLKMLIDAFKMIDRDDVELHVYGSGSYAGELLLEATENSRIKYFGVRPNWEILEAEYRATLLVNPRFITEEFTKYSFPSKNMEYMVSGTPLLTTKLPGMPVEYHQYVYLFKGESVSEYLSSILEVLSKSEIELKEFGLRARDYVLKNKNYICQGHRVVEFMCSDK